MLPKSITGSHKRKQAFSLQDPNNIELQWLATQAATKKAKVTLVSRSSHQASVEEPDARLPVFLKNPKNISNDDDDNSHADIATQPAKKKAMISKTSFTPNQKQNSRNIIEPSDDDEADEVAKIATRKPNWGSNRQASVEDIDNVDDHWPPVLPRNLRNIIKSDVDKVDNPPEKPAESAEAELSK
jgi:hypothetical protein